MIFGEEVAIVGSCNAANGAISTLRSTVGEGGHKEQGQRLGH